MDEHDEAQAARRAETQQYRKLLYDLPGKQQFYELASRPDVVYEIRNYSQDRENSIKLARLELPFLFKAFETGQARPPRPGTKKALQPRAPTIHEWLDWTITADEAHDDDDFSGFRVMMLKPRHRPGWPPPGAYEEEQKVENRRLGAPANPLPMLLPGLKPICAAVLRAGPGWLEIPFFATAETRRNRGFGRALLDAIEEVARALQLPLLLLCSTDDPVTKGTWRRLGFEFSSEEDLKAFGVREGDLMHMDLTVQMHKQVSPPRPWKPFVLKHQHWRQRLYYLPKPNEAPQQGDH